LQSRKRLFSGILRKILAMIDDNDLPTLDYYQARVEFFKTLLSPIPLEKIHDFVSEIQNNLINPFCDKYHIAYSGSTPDENWGFGDYEGIHDPMFLCAKNNEDYKKIITLERLLDTWIGRICISNFTSDYYPKV